MFFPLNKITKRVLFTLLLLSSAQFLNAQCFEIESILVDACGPGSLEGENEMIRFKVGASPLNVNNLSASFPTANSFLGMCQNAASSTATAALNATITNCGFLKEPPGGILPSNANVLFLTSTDVNITANSFANLNDTLYVIFQCAGNTGGHFGNNSSGIKNFSISFSTPAGCSDAVSWQNSNLIGGNGALVNFDPLGNTTFTNNGCQAPFNPVSITALNLTSLTICPGDSINLSATTQGSFQSYIWSGNFGNFNNPTTINSTYFSSINDTIPFYIKIGGITACSDTIFDSLLVNLSSLPTAIISEPDTNYICSGSNLTLHATGSNPFTWNNGTVTDSITISNAGMYYVNSSNNCATVYDTVYVTLLPQLNITILEPDTINLCQGNNITLHASGAPLFLWSNNATTDSIVINNAGLYTATANSTCPSNTDSVFVNVIPQLNIDILEPDTVNICSGTSITLHSSGSSTNLWSTGASNIDSIIVNSAGYYFVSATNSCFSDSAFIQINITQQVNITLTETDTVKICQGNAATLHANGANSYLWLPSGNTDSITVTTQGTYAVYGNTSCPSDTDYVFVQVTNPINLNITEGNSATLCVGSNLTLHATGGNNYIWSNNINTPDITINSIGTYYVESNNGVCPTQYDTINVINDFIPIASILGDTIFCSGEGLTVFANGIGNFTWSNGATGSSTTILTAQQLILTSANNCNIFVFDTLTIFEEDCTIETNIYAPNVITPNGDNMNDIFKVVGINVESMKGQIYNRWGQLLFEWDDINKGWNGTYKNKEAPNGTYIYTVQARYINGVNQRLTGHISLLK